MNIISEELWLKYFAGDVTTMQKRAIQQWISDPENADEYFTALDIWERNNIQVAPDVEAAKAKFKDFIDRHSLENSGNNLNKVADKRKVAFLNNNWLRSLTAVFLLGFISWLILKPENDYVSYKTTNDEIKSIQLSDSSSILLNRNSEVQVPNNFKDTDIRTVFLDGNARFNIKHTSDHKKFVVTTSHGTEIEVLGTEFDVFSSRDSSRIYLKSGSIKLISKDGTSDAVLIKPEDVVKIAADEKVHIEPKQKYWQYKAWEEHQFIFDASSMNEISTMLEKQFNMEIRIEDEKLKTKAISGTYQWKDEKDILYILADILNFQIEEQGNTFILKYNK